MSDLAVFTESIAKELIERGFELVGRTEKAWLFKDSVRLERTVSELVELMQEVDR